jgi:hypothetical protein
MIFLRCFEIFFYCICINHYFGLYYIDSENVEGFFSVCNTGISNDGAPRLHDIEPRVDFFHRGIFFCLHPPVWQAV